MSDSEARWRRARLALAGLALYGVFVAAAAPASVAAWLLARSSGGMATMEGAQGGLWRGRAAAIALSVPGTPSQRFGEVTWNFSMASLLRAEPAIDITTGGVTRGTARVVLRPNVLRIPALDVTAAAPAVSVLFPALQLVGASGEFAVRGSDLTIERDAVRGHLDVRWIDASSTMSPVAPLGTYRAAITAQGDHAEVKVSTERGALQIVGNGSWSPARGLVFTGEASATAARAAALQPLLNLFGPADGRGMHALRYSLAPRR